MCGISGYICKKGFVSNLDINKTLKLMKRRGPDNENFINYFIGEKEIGFLHSRLRILDLNDRSNQPFVEKNLSLIFNGEIYNYLEIKKKLKKKNYKFKTNSDTEVLLKSYLEYGENCVDHFEGMWSFAIWNNKTNQIFLSRDPFGEKPLYYYISDNGFFFGSEIKFILSLAKNVRLPNKTHLFKNLFLGYKSLGKSNDTFYKDIYSLESGNNLKVDLNCKINKVCYWKPSINIEKNLSESDAIEGVKFYLKKSLSIRMRADVPIAFCLSGGIDSSLLASYAKKVLNKNISTFSIIDPDERYNEINEINSVNKDLNSDENLIHLSKNKVNFFEKLSSLVNYHEGPIATISYYIHSFLSEAISRNNFKVAISGTGADELFTGYYDHYLQHLSLLKGTEWYERNLDNWKQYVLPNIRNPYLKDPEFYVNNPNNRDLIYEKNLNLEKYSIYKFNEQFKEIFFSKNLLKNRMMNELFYEVVPAILKHDDLNSMYYSIENRSPYLDKELLNFALTIPTHLLISKGYQKKILRDSCEGILTDKVRLKRRKMGFNASINSIVDLDKETIDYIFNKNSPVNEFVDTSKFKKDLDTKNIPSHISKFIFSIVNTNLFLEKNF